MREDQDERTAPAAEPQESVEGVHPCSGPAGGWGALRAVAHPVAEGSRAAYYPEANCLSPLASYDAQSGTPAYKSIPVTVQPAA